MSKFKRSSGIFLPVFSLFNHSGIGDFGESAYRFIDFLAQAKQAYWQILPINPIDKSNCPYLCPSAFALNPYFIDFSNIDTNKYKTKIAHYKKIHKKRPAVFEKAFGEFDTKSVEFSNFKVENASWLEDWCLFCVLTELHKGKIFAKWENRFKFREPKALKECKERYKNRLDYFAFLQFKAVSDWLKLKQYANSKGVKIIGDLPIYVSYNSSDVWANSGLFFLDDNLEQTKMAGCPPDGFSKSGQVWTSPLYDWDKHKETNFSWWKDRIRHSLKLFDVFRIDHFRGFESFYAIDAKTRDAKSGEWIKGPDKDFITSINIEFPNIEVIAESLGFITKEVDELLEFSGYPAMKVLQIGLGESSESIHLPENFAESDVAYTSTHDTDSLDKNIAAKVIESAFNSVAGLVIVPLYDYLDIKARINSPGTSGSKNWRYRVGEDTLSISLAKKIAGLVVANNR